jgi:hypothetical protein
MALGGGASVLWAASAVLAHDLARDEVTLWFEPTEHVLRGQLTLDPHPARLGVPIARMNVGMEPRVLAGARERLAVEVDGARCEGELAVRELWVPAGPTEGDIVMYRCPLSGAPHRLRIHAGPGAAAIVVSVRTSRADETPETYSVAVPSGGTSEPFTWDAPSPGWRAGGANGIDVSTVEVMDLEAAQRRLAATSVHEGPSPSPPLEVARDGDRLTNACVQLGRTLVGGMHGWFVCGLTAIGVVLGVGRRGRGRLRKQ